jgi:hypothetical protein
MVDARCLNARPEALQTAAMMQGGSVRSSHCHGGNRLVWACHPCSAYAPRVS